MRTPLTPVWDYETRIGALAVGNSFPGYACSPCASAGSPVIDTDWRGLSSIPFPWGAAGSPSDFDFDSDGLFLSDGTDQSSLEVSGLSVPARGLTMANMFLGAGYNPFVPGNREYVDLFGAQSGFSRYLYAGAQGASDVPGDGFMQTVSSAFAGLTPIYYDTAPLSGLQITRFDACGNLGQWVYDLSGSLVDFVDDIFDPAPGIPLNSVILGLSNIYYADNGPAQLRVMRTAVWNCYLTDDQLGDIAADWT